MLCLVTGANGHLGKNLVRALLEQGHTVRAGVRDTNNRAPFAGGGCLVSGTLGAMDGKAGAVAAEPDS
ncbi:NmrA family NAD(P)-binding protein [Pseudomonas sp. Z18(2022)]|uniref:NmrA family NAD(P)-binding protein n=1 Tax=Pseudomonas sp. Z18(2022) TaxID=2983410 RepID=UPI002E80580D|nr:NmrA family NAD(P)-binding protein [Pseudomonas sp. Z18(2022)]